MFMIWSLYLDIRRDSGEPAVYKWSRPNGLPLPVNSEETDYNRRLIIRDVQPEDAGEYTCTVTADAASAASTKSITLSIGGEYDIVVIDLKAQNWYYIWLLLFEFSKFSGFEIIDITDVILSNAYVTWVNISKIDQW